MITTGEGGAVTTDDTDLASTLRLYRGQGMDSEKRYWFPVVGYNYRMTHIAAAIGLAQLEDVDRKLHCAEISSIGTTPGWQSVPLSGLLNSHLGVPRLTGFTPCSSTSLVLAIATLSRGAGPVGHRNPSRLLPPPHHASLPGATRYISGRGVLRSQGLSLPTHTQLDEGDIERICSALIREAGRVRRDYA